MTKKPSAGKQSPNGKASQSSLSNEQLLAEAFWEVAYEKGNAVLTAASESDLKLKDK